ncbi:MAG: glycosyltransferase [candidate division KSB1 bacterium]|nr:glycosyltransferase [candidate division KSB1 bacterium]
MKLSVVIPAYNEIDTIQEIIRRVRAVPIEKEIIVIDDGSTDGTREVLLGLQGGELRVLLNDRNRGKGYALRRGFQEVTGDIVVIQDADLEYYPDEYPSLLAKILEGKADVVYGTRFFGAHRVFYFYHYVGNKILNLIANMLYDSMLTDLMTCYKAFRSDVLRRLTLHANGFGIEAEITAEVLRRGLRVYEVPISYGGREYHEGKKITWKDFFRSVYWLLLCKWRKLPPEEEALLTMRRMKNYNSWLMWRIRPFLGQRLVELGAGLGNMSALLTRLQRPVVLTEINPHYLEYIRERFCGNPYVTVVEHDIVDQALSELGTFDTALCINLLEHVEQDLQVLRTVHAGLEPGGRLILVVPAHPALYGSLDRALGHVRRYKKAELAKLVVDAGFEIEQLYYHNFPGIAGWLFNGCLLRRKRLPRLQARVFDKFVPLFRWFESRLRAPFGLSLIAICLKV